jgi:hypothetical protein
MSESTAERAHLRKWFSRKYGLSSSEVSKLLAHPDVHGLEGRLERWSEEHGLPAQNSPLSRGKLMEMVSADLKSDAAAYDVRAGRARQASSLRATVHERAAHALGWPVEAAQSMSLASLREAVRHVDPELADEMSSDIRSGRHITGKRQGSGKRAAIKADMSWIGEPPTAEASARYERERSEVIARNDGRPSLPPGTKRG